MKRSVEDVKAKIEYLFGEVQQKLGIKEEQIKAEFEKLLDPSIEDEYVRLRKAYTMLRSKYKDELRSPAIAFTGYIIGSSEPFDVFRNARRDALLMWQTDRKRAIAEGWCDEEGRPLDRRKVFSSGRENPNYGKPLPENAYIRNVIGVTEHDGEVRKFRLTLNEDLALQDIPHGVPVRFRANIARQQTDANWLQLMPSTKTIFRETDEELPSLVEILQSQIFDDIRVELADIPEFVNAHRDNPQRVCLVEAEVIHIADEPNETTGNLMIVLDDMSLDFDDPGVVAWVPEHLQDLITFGPGSVVYVIGQPQVTTWNDQERAMINTWGIFPDPDFVVEKGELDAISVS